MGRLLIDNCIRNNLVILNGRSFDDANHGKFMCDKSSVVDYVTCSPSLLSKVSMFKVDDFSPLLSATHYSISVSFELHVYYNVTDDASLSETTRIKRWNGNCSQTFASNLYTEAIDVILSSMPEVYIVDKDSINKINNDIAAVIFEAAEKKYGTSKSTKKVNNFDPGSTTNVKMLENIITDVERNIIWLKLLKIKTICQQLVNNIKKLLSKTY